MATVSSLISILQNLDPDAVVVDQLGKEVNFVAAVSDYRVVLSTVLPIGICCYTNGYVFRTDSPNNQYYSINSYNYSSDREFILKDFSEQKL